MLHRLLGLRIAPGPAVNVTAFGCTASGPERRYNEDAFLVADLSGRAVAAEEKAAAFALSAAGGLLAVADGHSGVAGSRLAVNAICDTLRLLSASPASRRLPAALETTHQRLRSYDAQPLAQRSAIIAALLDGDTAYLAQVGEARAYLVRNGRINRLTRQQTVPDRAVCADANDLPRAETGVLGGDGPIYVAAARLRLQQGDCLLLCSDGLFNKLREEEMAQVVNKVADVRTAARWLIAQARARGGEDNSTIVLARFHGAGLMPRHAPASQVASDLEPAPAST